MSRARVLSSYKMTGGGKSHEKTKTQRQKVAYRQKTHKRERQCCRKDKEERKHRIRTKTNNPTSLTLALTL